MAIRQLYQQDPPTHRQPMTPRRKTDHGLSSPQDPATPTRTANYSQIALGIDGVAHASWTDFRERPGVNTPNQDIHVSNFRWPDPPAPG